MSEDTAPRGRMLGAARLAAVQAIYEMEVAETAPNEVVAAFLTGRWRGSADGIEMTRPDPVLLAEIIRGVAARREEIDASISGALSDKFNVTRLEALLLAILRAGAYELSACPQVPAKVVINEYLDVAHAFFAGKEPGLVNAVLDRMAAALRPGEVADRTSQEKRQALEESDVGEEPEGGDGGTHR